MILECYVKTDLMMEAFENAGLSSYCYTKRKGQPWSILGDMIKTNQRLVVFTDNKDTVKKENWYHYVWDHAAETHFSVHKAKSFCCDYNRGADDVNDKDLFIFNHFITRKRLGIGRKRKSKKVNTYDFLLQRIQNCQVHTGKIPNFITIDFYSLGNAKADVDFLNDSSR